jgi:Co/Zn/Cd efflux system component
MHTTDASNLMKALRKEALELSRSAKIASKAAQVLPEARSEARRLQGEADSALAEALRLKDAARLQDLHLWRMEKIKNFRKGAKKYEYWMASWREGSKVRNVHLGSCKKLDHRAALQKARKAKAEALGIDQAGGEDTPNPAP